MENNFNLYPNMNMDSNANNANANTSQQNSNNTPLLQKILPLILSGKNFSDILPTLTNMPNINPMLANALSATQKNEKSTKKIESDKIDLSHLTKIN